MNLINIPAKEPRKEEEKLSPTLSWQLEERKQKNIAVSCMPSLVIKLSLGSVHKLVCTLELWLNIFSGIQEGSQGTEKATVMCRLWVDVFSLREQELRGTGTETQVYWLSFPGTRKIPVFLKKNY